ncbi:MAG: beta-galactosidase [Candidatus Omnitrophota bacterium]
MPKVEIKNQKIFVGKKEIPLISGEVHYWRLNPHCWREILCSVRKMGLEIISTYVPWDFHEYKRGHFDFTGKTDEARNLKAFLDLTRKEGFWLIIRPGPYIYSEWPHDGVPGYAHKYHRLHPRFLSYAEEYSKQVSKIFIPYLASRKNGHILMLQADNEIDPWPDTFGHQYGLSKKPGLFQNFMRNLYHGDLSALNKSWGTNYTSFREASPFIAAMFPNEKAFPLEGDKELKHHLDYFKFKHEYSQEVAKKSIRMYRNLGVDIPIYLNVYPFFYAHDWVAFQQVADGIGLDIYPSNEFKEDEFEHRKFCDKIRYLSSVSKLPFIAEFQSGIWHGRHYETGVFTPNHYRMTCLSAFLAGIKGWNWYMLVNRDNWYMSPINEWGRVRGELYDVFKQIVSVFRQLKPASLKKLTEIGVTFNPFQYAARTLMHNNSILVALYQGDVNYDMCDPRRKLPGKKVLFYSGNQWLEKSAHQNLRTYVEEGGTLVAFRSFPRKDDDFKPYQVVGFEEPERTLFEFKRQFTLTFGKNTTPITVISSVYVFRAEGCEKIQADLGTYGKQTVGYIKKIGKGKIIHLGVEPTPDLVFGILSYLKIPLASYSVTQNVKTALFSRSRRYFLVVVNNGNEDKSAAIYLPALAKIKKKMIVRDLMNGEKRIYSKEDLHSLNIHVARKDGRLLELMPFRG